MKTVDVYQVDAFAEKIFGGNPAGVVTTADDLSESEMQNIAREMNLSETAFVLQPSSNEAKLRLRFFTPTQEVPFCGHATVGALFQLAKLDMFGLGTQGKNATAIETGVGVLSATVANNGDSTKVTFGAPSVTLSPYRLQGTAFADAFGVPESFIKSETTILLDTTLNYLYINAASLAALSQQVFDFSRIKEQFGKENIVVFGIFSDETIATDADLCVRGLAPNVGIDEDPFTGSMQAGIVAAAKYNNAVDSNKELVVTEQGYAVGRPGKAEIAHTIATNEFAITASAVRVFSSKWSV